MHAFTFAGLLRHQFSYRVYTNGSADTSKTLGLLLAPTTFKQRGVISRRTGEESSNRSTRGGRYGWTAHTKSLNVYG